MAPWPAFRQLRISRKLARTWLGKTRPGKLRLARAGCRTLGTMSAQPESRPEPYEVIHLGGEAAAIVPLADLRRLRAVERHAPAEVLEEAEADATLAGHDEWVHAGRPGARSHGDVMAELLRGP